MNSLNCFISADSESVTTTKSGNISECRFNQPTSVIYDLERRRVWVGQEGAIGYIDVQPQQSVCNLDHILLMGYVNNIPTVQFFTGISRSTPVLIISCYHLLTMSGISKVMHCGILINMPYKNLHEYFSSTAM